MDAVASAIADPTRRDILLLLRRRAMSAGEIAGRFPVSRPAISRHLRVLRESGLVEDDVRGRQRIYRLNLTPLEPLEAWLGEMRDIWSGALDALETEVYRTRRERREERERLEDPNEPVRQDGHEKRRTSMTSTTKKPAAGAKKPATPKERTA